MMIRTVDFSQGASQLKSQEHATVFLKWTLNKQEQQSQPIALTNYCGVLEHTQVNLEYEATNQCFEIEAFIKGQSKGICKASAPAIYFLEKIGLIKLEFKSNDKVVGCVMVETFKDTVLKQKSKIDANHPHVVKNCMVCNDSHQDVKGTPFMCRACVCYKCDGTGIKTLTKTDCKAIRLSK